MKDKSQKTQEELDKMLKSNDELKASLKEEKEKKENEIHELKQQLEEKIKNLEIDMTVNEIKLMNAIFNKNRYMKEIEDRQNVENELREIIKKDKEQLKENDTEHEKVKENVKSLSEIIELSKKTIMKNIKDKEQLEKQLKDETEKKNKIQQLLDITIENQKKEIEYQENKIVKNFKEQLKDKEDEIHQLKYEISMNNNSMKTHEPFPLPLVPSDSIVSASYETVFNDNLNYNELSSTSLDAPMFNTSTISIEKVELNKKESELQMSNKFEEKHFLKSYKNQEIEDSQMTISPSKEMEYKLKIQKLLEIIKNSKRIIDQIPRPPDENLKEKTIDLYIPKIIIVI